MGDEGDENLPEIAIPSPQAFLIKDATAKSIWEKYYQFAIESSSAWDQWLAEKEEKDGDITGFAEKLLEDSPELKTAGYTVNQIKKLVKCGVYSGDRNGSGQRHTSLGFSVLPNGDGYIGSYVNSKRSGAGVYFSWRGGGYSGEYAEGVKNGVGVQTLPDGSQYSGEWKQDKRSGYGVFVAADGSRYAGQWEDGQRNGVGCVTLREGAELRGRWERGRISYGEWVLNDHARFCGAFFKNLPAGPGQYAFDHNESLYGEFWSPSLAAAQAARIAAEAKRVAKEKAAMERAKRQAEKAERQRIAAEKAAEKAAAAERAAAERAERGDEEGGEDAPAEPEPEAEAEPEEPAEEEEPEPEGEEEEEGEGEGEEENAVDKALAWYADHRYRKTGEDEEGGEDDEGDEGGEDDENAGNTKMRGHGRAEAGELRIAATAATEAQEGAKAAEEAIEAAKKAKEVEAQAKSVAEQAQNKSYDAPDVAAALHVLPHGLKALEIDRADDVSMFFLGYELRRAKTRPTQVTLHANISAAGFAILAPAISDVVELDVSGVNLGDAGAAVIATHIFKAKEARIKSLIANKTEIGVDGAVTLFGTAPASLETLALGAIPFVKEDDAEKYITALKAVLEKRKKLTLTLVKFNAKGPGPVEHERIKWVLA